MKIDVDLTGFLAFNSGGTVQQNKIDEGKAQPWIMFQRRPSNQDLFLSGNPTGLYETNFDVEIAGEDIDATEALTDSIKTLLHGYRGMMGFTAVAGAFVSDHEEDYTPKLLDADVGFHIATFALKIMHL